MSRPGGIVPHDDAGVVAEPAQGARLVVGVLLDSAPERPRVGDDDPDLHGATLPGRPDWTLGRRRLLGRPRSPIVVIRRDS